MLFIIYRKILNQKWLYLCLLFGSILVVASISCIPLYNNGVSQKLLIKQLEMMQKEKDVYAGKFEVRLSTYTSSDNPDTKKAIYESFSADLAKQIKSLNLNVLNSMRQITADYLLVKPEEPSPDFERETSIKIGSFDKLEDNVTLISGKMASGKSENGVYEAVVSTSAMKTMKLLLDKVYVVTDNKERIPEPLKFKVVGVFEYKENTSTYWANPKLLLENYLLISNELFENEFYDKYFQLVNSITFNYSLDYYQMDFRNVENLNKQILSFLSKNKQSVSQTIPFLNVLSSFNESRSIYIFQQLVLMIPILFMLMFYIFTVSDSIVKQDANEISILKSRGGYNSQIMRIYVYQNLLLGLISFAIGPFLGIFICQLIGSTSGFLEFVNRNALPVKVTNDILLYSALGVLVFMIATLIPAFNATKTNIVEHKQGKKRKHVPVYKKFFIDFLFLGISIYSLYSILSNKNLTALLDKSAAVDPLTYLLSTLFIFGSALLIVRIYPLIIALLYKIVKRVSPTSLYIALTNIFRNGSNNDFIIMFMILTVSLGVYSANTARTLNKNEEDSIRYETGADVVFQAYWESKPLPISYLNKTNTHQQDNPDPSKNVTPPLVYIEPDFNTYTNLESVEIATPVINKKNIRVNFSGSETNNVTVVGVKPNDFVNVGFFRSDLYKHHINEYMNLLNTDLRGVLISTSLQNKLGVKVGDRLNVKYGDNTSFFECYVFGIVDYWPSYDPKPRGSEPANLIVANFEYLRNVTRKEPYEVWVKLKPEYEAADLYNEISEKNIYIKSIDNTPMRLVNLKNDPSLQGTNGTLTLGFIITLLLCFTGYLIYWILNIKGKVLQYAVLSAIGAKFRSLFSTILWEQLFISVFAIFAGIFVGNLASFLYIPLIELSRTGVYVPPFIVVALASDYQKITLVSLGVIGIGFVILCFIISKIKINQAIKLGED